MSDNFQKLKDAILFSNIPFEERERFLMLFAQFHDEHLDVVAELFSEKEWMEKLYENYREKEQAAQSGDWRAFGKILAAEEDWLKSIRQAEEETG